MTFALRSAFILGIGLATGAPDTHTAPMKTGRLPEISQPPVGFPIGGFVFSGPDFFRNTPDTFEDSQNELRHLLPLRQL